jgi:hypothetical protein
MSIVSTDVVSLAILDSSGRVYRHYEIEKMI